MPHAIWKYELSPWEHFPENKSIKVKVPAGTGMLKLDLQQDKVCIWCQVDTSRAGSTPVIIEIFCFMTGFEIQFINDLTYLNTLVHMYGRYVQHFFYRMEREDK